MPDLPPLPDYLAEIGISRVEDLMVQAVAWNRIVAILSAENLTEDRDRASAWRREVFRRWQEEDKELRPARKDMWRARLDALYGDLLKKADLASGATQAMLYAEVTKVAKLAIAVDGIGGQQVPRRDGAHVDPAALSPIEREREIKELLAKREAAKKVGN